MNKNIKYSQNFLTSEKVLNQIIKQLNLKETDTVYEIGTGKGHLTTKLAKISKQVTSIELDSHLFNLSSEKLKLNTRVTLIHQDILQFQFPNKQRYKIVGSIPYHLSTQIIKKVVFESHASDIYLIVEEGFYKRTLDIHRTLGLLLHTQVSIQQLLKLPAECFHPKPKVNSVLIKLTRHTTDVPDKYWKLYTYFVSKWVNREYRQLFTKNQFHQAMKHAKVNNLSTVTFHGPAAVHPGLFMGIKENIHMTALDAAAPVFCGVDYPADENAAAIGDHPGIHGDGVAGGGYSSCGSISSPVL